MQLLRVELHPHLLRGLLGLHLLLVELHLLLVALCLLLQLLPLECDLGVGHRLRLELLHELLCLLDDRRQVLEQLHALLRGGGSRLRQHAVERAAVLGVSAQIAQHVADVLAQHVVGHLDHRRSVPQRDVLLEVAHDRRDELRGHEHAAAQQGALQVADVRLDVREVVLLGEGRDGAAQRGCHVLVDGVLLLGLHGRGQQLLPVGHLERLKQPLLDLARVVERVACGALGHGLHLREALRLAEDVGVAHRHHVKRAVEVLAAGQLLARLVLHHLVAEEPAIEAVQDTQEACHCVVQAAVDRGVDDCALLELGERRADRRVGVVVGDVLHRRADDALAGLDQEAQQLEQHRRRRVVGHGHEQLAHVIDVQAALDLGDLARHRGRALAADLRALELEAAGRVLDVRAVEQGAQCARRRAGQAADHVRQADGVRAAPRDEGELDEGLQLLAGLVVLVPVAVDREDLVGGLVDADDVGRGLLVVTDAGNGVRLEDDAQAVLVVAGALAALDLVAGLAGGRHLRLHAGQRDVHVAVHAVAHTLLVVELRQVLDVRAALGRVKVGSRVGQVHVVDGDEQEGRAVALLVPAHLEVLGTAQRHLRHELLKLGADLGALDRQLPVHELGLAPGLGELLLRDLARHEVLGRALRREDFLHGAGREVDAGLGHHGVDDARRASELSPAGRVLAQPGAADALLVLLVALLARLLVAGDQLDELRRQPVHVRLAHGLGEVVVELAIGGALVVLVVQPDDGSAVGRVLDVVLGIGEGHVLALDQVVLVIGHYARSCHWL